MMMRTVLTLAASALVVSAACIQVTADRITGRDLKAASAEFDSIPDDRFIAFAPVPGVSRALTSHERSAAGLTATNVCFERKTAFLSPAQIEAAMRIALPGKNVDIEIVDYLQKELPPGAAEFTLAGLPRPQSNQPDAPVIWRGVLRYDGRRTAPIWATVRVREQATWAEAVESIPQNSVVSENQVRLQSGSRFPLATSGVERLEDVVGFRAKRTVRAGAVLTREMFGAPRAVSRGDTVIVEVVSGAVRLSFEGRAETDGSVDDMVLVSADHRRLKARVQEKGKVIIDAKPIVRSVAGARGGSLGGPEVEAAR